MNRDDSYWSTHSKSEHPLDQLEMAEPPLSCLAWGMGALMIFVVTIFIAGAALGGVGTPYTAYAAAGISWLSALCLWRSVRAYRTGAVYPGTLRISSPDQLDVPDTIPVDPIAGSARTIIRTAMIAVGALLIITSSLALLSLKASPAAIVVSADELAIEDGRVIARQGALSLDRDFPQAADQKLLRELLGGQLEGGSPRVSCQRIGSADASYGSCRQI